MFFNRFICVKQQDFKDCGCACLATIFKQYEIEYRISELRETCSIDRNGVTISNIIKAADKFGFSAKAFKVSKDENLFTGFPLPAIANVIIDDTYSHFIVIHKITKKFIIIADPKDGIKKVKITDFLKIWTGIIIVLIPNSLQISKKGYNSNKDEMFIKKIFYILKPQKRLLINIFLNSILITILGIVSSLYIKYILNTIIPTNSNESLLIFSIGMIIITIFYVLFKAFRQQLLLYFTQRIDIPLMLEYYNHILNLPMFFFESRNEGEIISRLNDAYKIREAISGATLNIFMDSFMIIIGAIALYCQSSFLFYITLIPLIMYIIIVLIFRKTIENNNKDTMQSQAKITSYLAECINGIETIKGCNIEDYAALNIEKNFVKFVKANFKMGMVNNIQSTLQGGVKGIFGICILWIGVTEVVKGNMSIGSLLAFNSFLAYFLTPVENIVNLQSKIQSAAVAFERLEEIVSIPIEKENEESKKISPTTLKGEIEFKDVNFRYNSGYVLKDFNLKIHRNEKIALVGESGAGKTTLVKLLMNFYSCEKGEIIINGYNIEDINLEILRGKIAYISQETFLFNGTIIENLSLGNSHIKYEEIVEACKKSKIHDYINSLPLRYNTMIEENGSNFSGGQKQRLSIARAILKKPEILIMDEATSSLDSITEKAIEKTMNEFSENITTLVIAHRLSTIMRCDTIYVIEKGEIKEYGSHKKLLNQHGKYFELWKEQFPENYQNKEVFST